MMLVQATINLLLQLDLAQKQVILDTLDGYGKAVQSIIDHGFENTVTDLYKLQQQVYYPVKAESQLPSQLVISALHKASECLKSIKTTNGSKPKMKLYYPIRYDARSSTVWMDRRQISVSTKSGRIKINLQVPAYYTRYLTWKICSRELTYNPKKDTFVFHITYEKAFEDSNRSGQVIGIDLGLNNIAVTTQNRFYSGRRVKEVKNRYFRLRRALQSKGTRSAKRKLRTIAGREQRFMRDANHCISKAIISATDPHSIIVLEQLKHIRKRMNGTKKLKRRLHSWAFYQIQQFLTYKASKKSIAVEYVSAKYTSTKCSNCGHYQRGQRIRHQFKCQRCGLELNADLNGARNIKRNYQVAQGRALGDGRAVNPPMVATNESEVASAKKRN